MDDINNVYFVKKVINYNTGVEVRMTEDGKGRGLFATRPLRQGELIIVDVAITEASKDIYGIFAFRDDVNMCESSHSDLVKNCIDLM